MATHKGSEGTVKVGSNTVAEISSFTVNESAETIETTNLASTSRTYVAGLTSWDGSLECFWDETDTTGQGAMTSGAEVTLNIYPEGATSGDQYATGTAIITAISTSNGDNSSNVTASFTFQGTASLTWGAVS